MVLYETNISRKPCHVMLCLWLGCRFARLANMVEIEVEMDSEVPAAEVAGIEEQIAALEEVADLQAEARLQAQAQDEVERLLRAI